MKKVFFVLLATLPLISPGIEPVMIGFKSTNDVYTVPADKVLLIEHFAGYSMQLTSGYETIQIAQMIIVFSSETASYKMQIFPDQGAPYGSYFSSLNRPIKVSGGTRLTVQSSSYLSNPFYNGGTFSIFGLLVDPADLYASIETQSDKMLCQSGNFYFDVVAVSPRPSAIKLQGSTDLAEWHPVVAAEVEKLDASTRSVSIPVAGNKKYFVKSLLTSVPQ